MTTTWAYPEDVIVDCPHALSEEGLEACHLPSDLVLDVQVTAAGQTDSQAVGQIAEDVEMDCPLPETPSEDRISGHPLSNLFDRLRMWEHLETDQIVSGKESEHGNQSSSRFLRVGSKRQKPSAFFASAMVHSSFLCMLAFFPAANMAGTTGGSGNVIMVRVSADEDVVPQDHSPASIDSAASAPSKAKKEKQKEQPPPEAQTEAPRPGPDPGTIVLKEQPEPEKPKKPDEKQDGNAAQDSVASLPSTAGAERRFVPAAGQEGNVFEAMVLSAIREAIYYPKNAFNQRHHGEVVVAFGITKAGTLSELRITRPSDSAILNEAAVKIIEKAAKKFPPIPDSIHREVLHYVVPIHFKEKRGS